jgi:5-(carboxyamino)imidazole ribonucleotide synthase
VLDLPLGSAEARDAATVMINVLGGPQEGAITDRFAEVMRRHPEAKLHTYGKSARPGRKVGHVTVSGANVDEVAYAARAAAAGFDDEEAAK